MRGRTHVYSPKHVRRDAGLTCFGHEHPRIQGLAKALFERLDINPLYPSRPGFRILDRSEHRRLKALPEHDCPERHGTAGQGVERGHRSIRRSWDPAEAHKEPSLRSNIFQAREYLISRTPHVRPVVQQDDPSRVEPALHPYWCQMPGWIRLGRLKHRCRQDRRGIACRFEPALLCSAQPLPGSK